MELGSYWILCVILLRIAILDASSPPYQEQVLKKWMQFCCRGRHVVLEFEAPPVVISILCVF